MAAPPASRSFLARAWPSALALLALLGLTAALRALIAQRPLTLALAGHALVLRSPEALYALGLLPLLVLFSSWSLSALPPGRRGLSLSLRSLLVSCLVLALTRPAERALSTLLSTVFVLDVSDSISDAELAAMSDFVERARRVPGDHALGALSFAADAQRLTPGEQGRFVFARHADGAITDIESALSLALTQLTPDRIPQLVLLSDGRETRGDLG